MLGKQPSIELCSSFIKTLKGQLQPKTPMWFMRQAGRYLPEYKKVRETTSSFLEFCYNPEKASEVTLQPIHRFDFDAAIIFSDILVIPDALGMDVSFVKNEGPKLKALEDSAAIGKLKFDEKILFPVYEAIGLTRSQLDPSKALIGFAGAPWTLATYMIEGGSSRDFLKTKTWSYRQADSFSKLIQILTETVSQHCIAQIRAGADAIQIFDSWAGVLTEDQFRSWCIKPMREIVKKIKSEYPKIPIIGFPKGAGVLLSDYVVETEVDAVSFDQYASCGWVRDNIMIPMQGNLDPVLLMTDKCGAIEQTKKILDTLQGKAHIFNLGHGILPETPIENVEAVIKTVRG